MCWGSSQKRGKQKHDYAQCQKNPWEGLRCQEGPLVGGGRNAHTSVTETRPAGDLSCAFFVQLTLLLFGEFFLGGCLVGFYISVRSVTNQGVFHTKKNTSKPEGNNQGSRHVMSGMVLLPKTCSCWRVPVNKEAIRHSLHLGKKGEVLSGFCEGRKVWGDRRKGREDSHRFSEGKNFTKGR